MADGQENSVVAVHKSNKGVKPPGSASSHLNLRRTEDKKKKKKTNKFMELLYHKRNGVDGWNYRFYTWMYLVMNSSGENYESQDLKIGH